MGYKKSWICVLGVAILVGGYFFIPWHKLKKNIIDNNNLSVRVRRIVSEPVMLERKYIGYIVPIESVNVLPFINGFVDKILVSGGDNVTPGQELFIINQDQYKSDLDMAYAKVLEARASLSNAKIYYERLLNVGQRAISKTDLDNAYTALLLKEAELASSLSNYENAKINYNYTVISSPIRGIVGDVVLTKGDYVSPMGKALVKVIQYNPIRIVFSISNKEYLDELAVSKRPFSDWSLKLKLANGEFFNEAGKIKFYDNEISQDTSSIKVYADFSNIRKRLYPNAYVDVILEKKLEGGILIPQSVVYLDPAGSYVFVLSEDGKPIKKFIKLGDSVGEKYLIISGIDVGDILILERLSFRDLERKLFPIFVEE